MGGWSCWLRINLDADRPEYNVREGRSRRTRGRAGDGSGLRKQ